MSVSFGTRASGLTDDSEKGGSADEASEEKSSILYKSNESQETADDLERAAFSHVLDDEGRPLSETFGRLPRKVLEKYNPEMHAQWKRALAAVEVRSELVQMLKRVKLFSPTSFKLRELIVDYLLPVQFCKGEYVTEQGDKDHSLVVIVTGRGELWKRMKTGPGIPGGERKLGDLTPGASAGENLILGLVNEWACSILAKETLTGLVITRDSLHLVQTKVSAFEVFDTRFLNQAIKLRNMVDTQNSCMTEYFVKTFRGISSSLLEELGKQLELKVFLEGDRIMKEGEYGECMYILEHGTVSVDMQGSKVARYGRGKVFGEMAVLGSVGANSSEAGHQQLDSMRTASVTCVSLLCVVKVLFAPVFQQLLENFPGEIARFDQYYISRQTHNDLEETRKGLQALDEFYGIVHPFRDPIYSAAADSKQRSGSQRKTKLFTVGAPRIADVLCTQEKQNI